jgi:cohesin complex subunit SA-1/2
MAIQILFCPERAVDGPIPSTSLVLTLDDEVQYRCAGYIQAEIERYAEDVDGGKRDTVDSDDGRSSDDDEETENEPEKGKKGAGKGKKTPQGVDVSGM